MGTPAPVSAVLHAGFLLALKTKSAHLHQSIINLLRELVLPLPDAPSLTALTPHSGSL